MNKSKSQQGKIQRKVQRCQILLKNDMVIEFSEVPTKFVCVLNAGLLTGLSLERLLEEIQKHDVTVQDISMVPGKSYCFISFKTCDDSQKIVEAMHATAPLGQKGSVVYMAYCDRIQLIENLWSKSIPDGIFLLEDFITEEEEQILLAAIDVSDSEAVDGSLKHRLVKHFGYEFIYGRNTVDPARPLDRKIPSEFGPVVIDRLHKTLPQFSEFTPEQMTVNKYEPGQGIPPHVDTHSPFADPIVSLSLLGDTVMEFRSETRHSCLYLPKRSLLVMSGESRYGWTHSITPRMTDVVQKSEGLSMRRRETRVSCTFRQLRKGPCCCQYPKLCDSQKSEVTSPISTTCDSTTAASLEQQNVHQVYNEIASHFSETRHSPWPKVQKFLLSFDSGSFILDIGCGNGKYLNVNPDVCMIGCDRSEGLLKVCLERSFNVFQCDCLAVPFKDASLDGCISIAVIHHLFTDERRKQAIEEMARILRPGGRGLIYVWAKNQEADSRKSSYLRQNKENNRRIRKKDEETGDEDKKSKEIQLEKLNNGITLPVHTNRTQFAHQDVLVPWKLKGKSQVASSEETKTFLRYYHVFNEGELEALCKEIPTIKINDSYYDQGNWCVIFEKIS